jgi:hypothetical protein
MEQSVPKRQHIKFRRRTQKKAYNTLHVSDGLSVPRQKSKTVHTASYHTGSVAACQQAATEPVRHMPDAVCTFLDS